MIITEIITYPTMQTRATGVDLDRILEITPQMICKVYLALKDIQPIALIKFPIDQVA